MSKQLKTMPDCKVTNFLGMLTASEKMLAFFNVLQKAACSEAPVLLRGETGTGKELAARAIHHLSRRETQPYHALNCATLTPELMQSELFGHVKGAFTGAVADRTGLFEAAHKGTLFLDEIAELPIDIQARLLRVLQEQKFHKVGSLREITSDVRLISATHTALRKQVKDRKFRSDLMYRIRVVPIFIPRLIERDRDIEVLVWNFIEQLNKRSDREVRFIHVDALDALYGYSWPGNVRELLNNIEYAFVMGDGEVINLKDLTPELQGLEPEEPFYDEDPSLIDEEIAEIRAALRKSKGRKAEAAELLGISRATLWRKIREYGIR